MKAPASKPACVVFTFLWMLKMCHARLLRSGPGVQALGVQALGVQALGVETRTAYTVFYYEIN